ncbi:hypothetical protein BpHYR1_019952 [Brachionus plicatilis]|uniref:Uncharacterized protein n=1 Tax=Brachionus plicatilis TaxID=10195 RepID=A0A3M7S5R8_BRAPC|nr:hypothetical protein BpHYR1_019952 [Brachionus plicatilis]
MMKLDFFKTNLKSTLRNWIRKIGTKIAIISIINVTIICSVNSFTINSLDSESDKLTFGHDSSINTNNVIYSSDFDTKFLHNINEVITKIYRLIEKSGLLRIIIITGAVFIKFASKEENKWILDESINY